MNKKLLKDFAILFGIIIVAAVGARFLAKGETLSEYARNNKEAAGIASSNKEATASFSSDISASDHSSINESTEGSSDQNMTSASENISSTLSSSKEESTDSSEIASSQTKVFETESPDAPLDDNPERITYMDGFYYEPISNEIFRRISGISYPVDCQVPLDELRYISLLYIDFNGETRTGEMICNKDLAQDIVEIFYELYKSSYQIESIKLIDEFGGDDNASMLANNTSCFNYRVVEGTTHLSNHALGRAVDINPFYNPYITYNKDGTTNVFPTGSEKYADRTASFPYKIDENDLSYKLFIEHGFTWGGNWNSVKDYQHFEKK